MAEQDKRTNTQAKSNEIRLANFIVEHNIAISAADHLMDLIKGFDKKSAVLQKMSCHRTKCTSIIEDVIGKDTFAEVVKILRENEFSLLIDESNDRGSVKQLVLIARVLVNDEVQDLFVTLLQPQEFTAEAIYRTIVNFFESDDVKIPYKEKMIAFASDGANVLMGSNNSVVTRFRNDIPHLFVLKCICHSLALCASHATAHLPDEVENLIKGVYLYIKYSSKRLYAFQGIQMSLELPDHKLLNTSNTRWLSLQSCVARFLEQIEAITKFLSTEDTPEAKELLRKITTPQNILYLKFLNDILPIVINVNVEFQSEQPKIQVLYQRMESCFRTILERYIDDRYLQNTPVENIGFANPVNFVPLEKIDLGAVVNAELQTWKAHPQFIQNFRKRCQNFYVQLATEINSRFPFNDPSTDILRFIGFIDPMNLPDIKSISPVAEFFGMNKVEVDNEYKIFRKQYWRDPAIHDEARFWKKVASQKKGDGTHEFPLVLKLYRKLKILPHSSASCERVFSTVKLNKTDVRNRMEDKLLIGILYGKTRMKISDSQCYNFNVPQKMLDLHNKNMYAHKQQKREILNDNNVNVECKKRKETKTL